MSRKRRFNLVLPEDMLAQVEQLAEEECTSVVEIFRRFVKLGLIVTDIQNAPDKALLIKRGDHEREVLII